MHKKANTSSLLQIKSMIMFIVLVFSSANLLAEDPHLFIKSSFDGTIVSKTDLYDQKIIGTDPVTGYSWMRDLPGDTSRDYFNFVINDYKNYLEFTDAKVVNTTGHDEDQTKALYIEFKKDDPTHPSATRCQFNMRGIPDGDPVQRLDQGYIKYRMKAHITGDVNWWMPIEWKQEGEHYRVSLYAYKTDTDKPYWYLKGQEGTSGPSIDWAEANHDIPVPQDEWYTLEFFWVGDPDRSKGRMQIAINGQILFDIRNRTKFNNNMYYFSPFKIYGSPGHSWITDFEYWDKPPSTSVLSENYAPGSSLEQPSTAPETPKGSFVISPGILK